MSIKVSIWLRRAVIAAAAAFAMQAVPASAGTIILEGSDAIGFHCAFGDAGACTYRDEAWTAIGGADSRPIAVFGNTVNGSAVGSGTHAVVDFANVAAAGSLSNYVALYFLAGSGCCTEDDSLIIGNEAAVSAYLTAGGTVMIENYIGGPAWDFAVGTGGTGNAHVAGVGGGLGGGSCDDGEAVTADGMSNGFVQPPVLSCWEHQGYEKSFYAALGFTHSFFDAAPSMGGAAGFSGLLSSGVTVSHDTPEPLTLTLFGAGLAGLAGLRRRRKKAA